MAKRIVANNCMSADKILQKIIEELGRQIFISKDRLCSASDAVSCQSRKALPCARCAKFEITVKKIDERS